MCLQGARLGDFVAIRSPNFARVCLRDGRLGNCREIQGHNIATVCFRNAGLGNSLEIQGHTIAMFLQFSSFARPHVHLWIDSSFGRMADRWKWDLKEQGKLEDLGRQKSLELEQVFICFSSFSSFHLHLWSESRLWFLPGKGKTGVENWESQRIEGTPKV